MSKTRTQKLKEALIENDKLRVLLALTYSGEHLYADDNELLDTADFPLIDFRKDSPDTIERKIVARKTGKPASADVLDEDLLVSAILGGFSSV